MRNLGGMLLIVIGAVCGAWWLQNEQPHKTQREQERTSVIPARVVPHLNWADRETHKAISEALEPLDELFSQAKRGTPAFAEEVLSLTGGKWQYLWSTEEQFKQYLQQQFSKHVLKPDAVRQAVKQSLLLFQKRCESIDSELFVRIQADVPGLQGPELGKPDQFAQQVEKQMAQLLQASGDKIGESLMRDTVGGGLAVFIGEELVTWIIVSVAQRAGLITAGGLGSMETLGVSLVVGFVLDWLWDWWTDPEGQLSAELNEKLDGLHGELRAEVRRRMEQMATARSTARVRLLGQVPVGK